MIRPDRRPLDDVLIGGREKRAIVICPYDPEWAVRFTEERRKILEALGPAARAVHHVGSTSVEGLAAKPIVDIIVEMDEPDEATFLAPLERAGYELRVREPDHWMLRTPAHDVHVHIWVDADDVRRHLVFRDRLRTSPADRAAYEALKIELAEQEWEDMNDYADAKSAFFDEIVARA
jgi:GrpB-like predicted nucleotidyltransferase (UPF0157 family)